MIAVAASALCGLISGLLYDLLRVFRRGKWSGVLCDVFFCLFCTAAMFLTGMAFCGGRPGVWEPFAFAAVFGLYLFGVSPSITPLFGILWEKRCFFLKKGKKNMK